MDKRTDGALKRVKDRKASISDIFFFINLLRTWLVKKGEEGKLMEKRFVRDLNQLCLKWWDSYNDLCAKGDEPEVKQDEQPNKQ